MKIEEVIKQLESILDHTRSMAAEADADGIWKEDIAALEFAITALRSMLEAGEYHLRDATKMVPLSLEQLREVPHGKIKDSTLQNIGNRANEIASPPAHIDRRAWTAEWVPTTDDDGCVWLECSACEYDLDSMEESNPFCPSCGRAMTEEAWTELERRLRG